MRCLRTQVGKGAGHSFVGNLGRARCKRNLLECVAGECCRRVHSLDAQGYDAPNQAAHRRHGAVSKTLPKEKCK